MNLWFIYLKCFLLFDVNSRQFLLQINHFWFSFHYFFNNIKRINFFALLTLTASIKFVVFFLNGTSFSCKSCKERKREKIIKPIYFGLKFQKLHIYFEFKKSSHDSFFGGIISIASLNKLLQYLIQKKIYQSVKKHFIICLFFFFIS